jgi:hypothetical protein
MPKATIHDHEILQAALQGLEHSLAAVEGKIAELRRRLGMRGAAAHQPKRAAAAGKRRLSPAARRRIAAAQKKRWAAFRKMRQNK